MLFTVKKSSKSTRFNLPIAVVFAIPFVFFTFGFFSSVALACDVFISSEAKQNNLCSSGALPLNKTEDPSQKISLSLAEILSVQKFERTIPARINTNARQEDSSIQNISIAIVDQQTHYTQGFDKNLFKPIKTIANLHSSSLFATQKQARLDKTPPRVCFQCFPASVCDTKT